MITAQEARNLAPLDVDSRLRRIEERIKHKAAYGYLACGFRLPNKHWLSCVPKIQELGYNVRFQEPMLAIISWDCVGLPG